MYKQIVGELEIINEFNKALQQNNRLHTVEVTLPVTIVNYKRNKKSVPFTHQRRTQENTDKTIRLVSDLETV